MESDGEVGETALGEPKVKKKNITAIALVSIALIILVMLLSLFAIPIKFEKYSLTTGMVQYNSQESYQKNVNSDNCNSNSDCVCTKHGGFLWLTCVQCSCTAEITVVREKLGLKEGTTTGSANIYQTLTNSKISEYEAKQITQTLTNFISQQGQDYVNIGNIIKEGNNWKVEINYQNYDVMYVYLDTNTGQILYVESYGQKIPFSTFIAKVNS